MTYSRPDVFSRSKLEQILNLTPGQYLLQDISRKQTCRKVRKNIFSYNFHITQVNINIIKSLSRSSMNSPVWLTLAALPVRINL